ncbi:MAG: flagellar hook-length control protein FliK [Caulobacteraceae bacterium]|nr:flagellar hook-length control protein FliK [Caulobacteraceae bacterium]
MRPADLLALAASAPRPAPAATSPNDDAFARVLDTELRSTDSGEAPCGLGPSASTDADTQAPRAARPVRERPAGFLGRGDGEMAAAIGEWRDFLASLREMGVMHVRPAVPGDSPAASATPGDTARTTGTSTPKTASPLDAFGAALDLLGQAIQAALADPAANAAQPGQLPPAVQTALDAAIAAAPAPLQERLHAFAGRITTRLAAAMAAVETAGADQTAASDRPASQGARHATPIAQALLAAGNGSADSAALSLLNDLKSRGHLVDQMRSEGRAAMESAPRKPVSGADGGPAARSMDAPPVKADAGSAATPAAAADAGASRAAAMAAESRADLAVASTPDGSNAASSEGTPATSATPAPAAPAHVANLAATRGAPELVAQLAATISRKLEGRVTRFNMELNPAELGRVDVKLSIEADGRLAAQMSFDNPAAAADMRGKADELRRQLEQAGFSVRNEDLTFSDREQGQGFAQSRSSRQESDAVRGRAFRDADRTARLAEDAGRLANRAVLGLDMKV